MIAKLPAWLCYILLIAAACAWLEIFQPLFSQLGHPWEVFFELCAMAVGWATVIYGAIGLYRIMRAPAFMVILAVAAIGLMLYELAPGIVGVALFYAIELHRDCLTKGCI
jgi:hypothetical protein